MEHCGPCPSGGKTGASDGGVIDPTFGILTEIVRLHEHSVQLKAAAAAQKGAAQASKAAADSRAHDLNEQGLNAWKAGNYDVAESFFQQALPFSPGNPVIASNLRQASERIQSDKARTAEIHQGLDRLSAAVDRVQAVASVPGLDFDGAATGSNSTPSDAGSLSANRAATSASNDPMVVDARFDTVTLQAVVDSGAIRPRMDSNICFNVRQSSSLYRSRRALMSSARVTFQVFRQIMLCSPVASTSARLNPRKRPISFRPFE